MGTLAILLRKIMKSFTLVEVLLVIGIIAILIAIIAPMGIDFYKNQQLDNSTQMIINTLRRAQLKAMSIELDANYGVYFTEGSYTLFKGNSFADRDVQYDELFELSSFISINETPKEFVFSKFEGEPSINGDIFLTNGLDNQTININEIGRVNLE